MTPYRFDRFVCLNVTILMSAVLQGFMAAVMLFFVSTEVLAQPVKVDTVEAELIADVDAVVAGQPFRLGLRLKHDKGWHTYWENPGDSGLPTQFKLTMPNGFSVAGIDWPRPARFLIPPLANLGYEREILLARSVTPPATISGKSVTFTALAQWLVCREVCIPGETNLNLTLPVQTTPGPEGAQAWFFKDSDRQLPSGPETVSVAAVNDRLHIRIPQQLSPQGSARRIEYFARQGDSIQHAAPQQLYLLADGSGWRLEVELNKGLAKQIATAANDPLALTKALAQASDGVLVFDESKAVQVKGQGVSDASAFVGGKSLGPVEGHLIPFFAKLQGAAADLKAALNQPGSLKDRIRQGTLGGGQAVPGRQVPPSGAISDSPTQLVPPAAAAAAQADMTLWIAVGFAMIGGLILNLMPCVFPVIGLKILGFAGHGALGASQLTPEQKQRVRSGCFWFALGVIGSFLILAGIMLALRSGGQSIGWGFQLQSPPFVAMMALLFLAVGLNFSGLFEVGTAMTRLGQLEHDMAANQDEHAGGGWLSSMGAGALAVLVATPCTAPFMGGALGYTLGQSAGAALLVFAALGLGMALPYILLGLVPGWLRLLPKPGRWMISLREFLAFPMYAAAAWLAWVLGKLMGVDSMLWLTIGMVLLAFGLWIWGRYVQKAVGSRWQEVAMALSVVVCASALALAWPMGEVGAKRVASEPDAGWSTWSQRGVSEALAAGHPVLIDFTASWCITCQVNKKLVFETADIRAEFSRLSVRLFQADWTAKDPAITAELARNGRNSVPLYLLYAPGKPPVVLPEILTKDIVRQALANL